MHKNHKVISILIFSVVLCLAYGINIHLTELVAQNLVTFFSVVFGFYITCIAIIYNSAYSKQLFKELDPKDNTKRKIHTLRTYIKISGFSSLTSIVMIIVYALYANTNQQGLWVTELPTLNFDPINFHIDIDLLLSSTILGGVSMSIFLMIVVFNTILSGMVEAARG